MAVMGSNSSTLIDVANSLDPDGRVAKVAELLNQTNALLEDMPFIESNMETGHRSVVRTGLPSATWHDCTRGSSPPSPPAPRLSIPAACWRQETTLTRTWRN